MEAQGVTWLPADKKPGSRINGASLLLTCSKRLLKVKAGIRHA
jgi:hypothetical protein